MITTYIRRTPNADSRTATGELDKDLVRLDTSRHIYAVNQVLCNLADDLKMIGANHDHTKLSYFNEFYNDLSAHKLDPTNVDFKKLPWWKIHLTERHHLNDSCPDDVDLLDVLEMLVDGVCAGKARSGGVYPIELSNDILQKALKNTQKMLERNIKVSD